MEHLETVIQQKEAEYISKVEAIVKMNYGNRIKASLINKHYIKLLVEMDDLVSGAKLQTPPAVEVSA